MMTPRSYRLLADLIALALLVGAVVFFAHDKTLTYTASEDAATNESQLSSVAAAENEREVTPATDAKISPVQGSPKPEQMAQNKDKTISGPTAYRIQDPYPTPPLPGEAVNSLARNALVNIFCHGNGALRPISGSGVIIDPRGVILTNAHVAQYVLLSQHPRIDLDCFVRTGAPAKEQWVPQVLYIPEVWVRAHAADINADKPLGTGEHDYALLYTARAVGTPPLLAPLPYIPTDTREVIAFPGDTVLVASYPAELSSGIMWYNLYPVSSFTSVKELLTFAEQSVDAIAVGGVIGAQGGSSGGAIVNMWGRLVALISTTSEGKTTAERTLRGITLAYINRDFALQTGTTLETFIAGDIAEKAADFTRNAFPTLIHLYLEQLSD